MSSYYVSFSYPDGHIEEIEEAFPSLKDAQEYGLNLLNQVRATELYKKQGSDGEDSLPPSFSIREVSGGRSKVVFVSR